jgi:putative aldouronate transport system substrate-binding protein
MRYRRCHMKRIRVLALLLAAAALILPLAGCGGTGAGGKEVEITIWNDLADKEGVQSNPIADEIAKRTGVRMNAVKGDAEKFQVLQAGGDLPGIIFLPGKLLDSTQLIALDKLVADRGKEIQKSFPQILSFSRQFMSSDGKLYYLPVHIYRSRGGVRQITKYAGSVSIFGRWDVYAKAGYPTATNETELLAALRAMQDVAPKTPEGKKVYALSGWTDWGIWPYYITTIFGDGYTDLGYGAMYSRITGEIKTMYNSDEFFAGLSFFNKAYRAGLLDPEAFTMKFDDYYARVKAGQVLTVYAGWWAEDLNGFLNANGKSDWGFQLIPNGLPYVPEVYVEEWPLGWQISYAHAITTNCKNPEKAMDLINFCYSEEGAKLIYRGVKGVHWEVVNGVPQMTKEMLDKSASDSNYRASQGFLYSRLVGWDNSQMLSDKGTADLTRMASEIVKSVVPSDTQFATHYGNYQYPGQAVDGLIKNGTYKTNAAAFYLAPLLVKEPSDDAKKAIAQVEQYLADNIAKIIMAKDDAAFAALKAKFLKDMNTKGYDKAVAEQQALFQKAQEDAKSFKLE